MWIVYSLIAVSVVTLVVSGVALYNVIMGLSREEKDQKKTENK